MQKKLRILVSGGSGFVGNSLLEYFNKNINFKHNELFALYNNNKIDKKFKNINKIKINLLNFDQTKKLLIKISPDIIFHLAAFKNPSKNETNVVEAFKKNFVITKNIINNINNKKSKFIFLSTDKVYSGKISRPSEEQSLNPNTFYGLLKLQTENLIKNDLLNYIILRVPIIHSKGLVSTDSFIDESLYKIKKKKKTFVAKNIKRQFIDVTELSKFLYILKKSKKVGIYNIASKLQSYYHRVKDICNKNNITCKSLLIEKNFQHSLPIQDLNDNRFKKNFFFKFN